MAFPPARVKQSTNTTGTGTLTLNGASSEVRSFQAGFGSGTSIPVRYILSRAGVFEIGYGVLNTTAGTLTRDEVEASSSGGALVSLAAGTTDVFFDFLPGDRQIRTISANTTLTRADLGVMIRCTQTADITATLPPIATVPGGTNQLSMGYLFRNDGSNGTIVWIDPNGSEFLDGFSSPFPLFPGEAMEILSIGTAWRSSVRPMGWRSFATALTSNAVTADFILPSWGGSSRTKYRFEFSHLRPATNGAVPWLRVGAGSFDFGGSDYISSLMYVTGAATLAGQESTASAVVVGADLNTTSVAHTLYGTADVFPGKGGIRYPLVKGQSIARGNGGSFAGWQSMVFGGVRNAAKDIDRVQFLMSTGNIALGDFVAFVCFD